MLNNKNVLKNLLKLLNLLGHPVFGRLDLVRLGYQRQNKKGLA